MEDHLSSVWIEPRIGTPTTVISKSNRASLIPELVIFTAACNLFTSATLSKIPPKLLTVRSIKLSNAYLKILSINSMPKIRDRRLAKL